MVMSVYSLTDESVLSVSASFSVLTKEMGGGDAKGSKGPSSRCLDVVEFWASTRAGLEPSTIHGRVLEPSTIQGPVAQDMVP